MIHGNYGTGVVVTKSVSSATTMDAVPASSERILVIEDDRAVQKALKRLFEAEGFAVWRCFGRRHRRCWCWT